MASRLNPYLNFSGEARAAMEFYQGIFGGALRLNTFAEFGAQDSPDATNIMHGMLETDSGFTLMGADVPTGTELIVGTNFTVSLSGDDAAEMRGYWEKLTVGGTIEVPLEKQMWGDEFGMGVDKFGVSWMVNIAQPEG